MDCTTQMTTLMIEFKEEGASLGKHIDCLATPWGGRAKTSILRGAN
jgi:hypothetical protein